MNRVICKIETTQRVDIYHKIIVLNDIIINRIKLVLFVIKSAGYIFLTLLVVLSYLLVTYCFLYNNIL